MIQRGKLGLLTLVHVLTDFYSSLLTPILPAIVAKLNLSLTQAGVLAGLPSLTSSLVQPLMGILGDRMEKRYFILIGPLFAAVFMSAVGLSPTFGLLLLCIVLGGFGTASFHPQSVSMAGEVSGTRRAFGVSLFIGGGTVGLAISPLLVTRHVESAGLENLIWLALPGVVAVILLSKAIPIRNAGKRMVRLGDLKESFRPNLRAMILLTVVVIFRTLSGVGFATFLTLLMQERGFSLKEGGDVLMLYQVGAVIGGFIGGWASDRLGRARVIWTSIMLSTPFLLGSLFETGLMMYMLLFIGGFMNMASNSVSIALAQELVPDNAGTASSFPMGFSWGIAGLGVMICGGVAERVGVESTMIMLSLLPILAGLLALMLPRDPGRRRASAPPVNAPVPETQTA